VIVPNSQIGKNQVVNYSYPDPSVYDMTSFVVAYENDQELVRQLIMDTVSAVDGVLGARHRRAAGELSEADAIQGRLVDWTYLDTS
jgi:small-conductance mechanosensitive channel